MKKAIAVWLLKNTKLTHDQIARSLDLHPLEVNALATGHLAGEDPTLSGQLTREEIKRCEGDPAALVHFVDPSDALKTKKASGRTYTSIAYRKERPRGILWLLENHPELSRNSIARLLATTPQTIRNIQEQTHPLSKTIKPANPVLLGLCSEDNLQAMLKKAEQRAIAKRKSQTA